MYITSLEQRKIDVSDVFRARKIDVRDVFRARKIDVRDVFRRWPESISITKK